MIQLKDYPSIIDKIGINNLNDAQREAHSIVEEGSSGFTDFAQLQELMDSTPEIKETVELYFGQLEKLQKDKDFIKEHVLVVRPGATQKPSFELPEILKKLMPKYQQAGLQSLSQEGKEEMKPVLERLAKDLSELPADGAQDGMGKKAIVHAHYFTGASDWWITEWDGKDGMFGYVVLNGDVQMSEFGYISVSEITSIKEIELDFYWKKKTLDEALHNAYPKYFQNPKETEEVEVEESAQQEPSLKPKFAIGDYVKYKGGDEHSFTWHGIIRSVVPLENEFAYRIDAYGKSRDGILYSDAAHNEVYEAQLSPSSKENIDKLKQAHFAEKSHAKPSSKKAGKEQPGKESKEEFVWNELYELAQTDPAKARMIWNKLDKRGKASIKKYAEETDAADEGIYKGFLYLISDKNIKATKATSNKKPEKAPKPPKQKKPGKYDAAVPIERELESVRFIRRYVGLHNRVKTKEQIMSLIDGIQKAISERRITKEDLWAKEITYVQRELVKFYNGMKRQEKVELTEKELKELGAVAFSQKPMDSIRFLKRYISLDGKTNVKEKAKKLYADIENAIHKGKITESDKYYKALDKAHQKLFAYIQGRTKVIEVWDAELNGVRDFFQSARNTAKAAYSKVAPVVKKAGRMIKKGIDKAKPHVKKAVTAAHQKIKEHTSKPAADPSPSKKKESGIKFIIARPLDKKTTEVQSVLFRTDMFTEEKAEKWLENHGFYNDKHEVTGEHHRFRQHAVAKYQPGSFKTIKAYSKKSKALGFLPLIARTVAATLVSNGVNRMINHKNGVSGTEVAHTTPGLMDDEGNKIDRKWGDDDIFRDLAAVKSRTGTFMLKSDIGRFLGDLERNRLAMTIEGDKGGGKTQLAFQLADAFAEEGMSVGFFQLEMPADSDPIKRNRDMYIKPGNMDRIKIADQAPQGIHTIREFGNKFDVIIIDTWTKLDVDSTEFDKLRNDFPNTVWIVVFQMAANKIIRGGTAPLFDAGINIEVKKPTPRFEENYAIATKNRYGATGIPYNIAFRAILD